MPDPAPPPTAPQNTNTSPIIVSPQTPNNEQLMTISQTDQENNPLLTKEKTTQSEGTRPLPNLPAAFLKNPLPNLDIDTPMAPPTTGQESPKTPTQTRTTNPLPPAAIPNRETDPSNTLTMSESIAARLEEAESERAMSGGGNARNPIDKYTPGPMPTVHDNSPTSIFEHIDIKLIKEWEARLGGKLIAVPFDVAVKNPDTHDDIRSRILTAIVEILNAQEASVAAPKPVENPGRGSRTPTSFLIYNISHEQATFLLDRGVWSSRAITFRVAPFAAKCPSFFFAIKGFGTIAEKEIYPIVRKVWESDETKDFIDELLTDTPPHKRALITQDLENLIYSVSLTRLDTKGIGNTLCPRYNIYAQTDNFTHDKLWSRLRDYLHSRSYTSVIESQSSTEKIPFRCSCCHGVDHPRGLCPFFNIAGWNGPTRDPPNAPQRRNGEPQRGPRTRYAPY